jgi:ceroid-lipofuscinosis MFS transporter 7
MFFSISTQQKEEGQPSDSLSDLPRLSVTDNNVTEEATTNYVSMETGQADPHSDAPEKFVDEDELEEEDHKSMGSLNSSVLTADGIHDIPGFLVVCMVILMGDMSRGVFFPTLWPLVRSLGGSTVTLGYAVAAFSAGRIITSPIFGSLSVTIGYTKTLLISVTLLLLGTLVYAQVQNLGSAKFVIIANSILGVGSGTLGVTRAFVADVTAKRTRTRYMAWITAVQYAGFTVTPFVGALLTMIFGDNDIQAG